MHARDAIKLNLNCSQMICHTYLSDLSDQDLLVRPGPGLNHIAWQLGHLLVAEQGMLESAFPGSMPALPAGFVERYTTATSKLDSASAFHSKAEYLQLAEQLRTATVKVLDKLSDTDLDQAPPDKYKDWMKSVGDLISMQGSHWMMHAGQWAVVRRKLGKPPLF